MKARDIIPSWPRGRSSSRPIRIPSWFRFAYFRAKLESAANPIFGPSDEAFEDFTRTNIILFFEAEDEAKYRAEQERKLAEWRINHARVEESAKTAIFAASEVTTFPWLWNCLQRLASKTEDEILEGALLGAAGRSALSADGTQEHK
jgi:hypothetical protein